MIRRFYVHNYRCLENFELAIGGMPSVLLIGRNGSGKTTVCKALEILQKIGRGTNRIKELIEPMDQSGYRIGAPIRFEIEAEIEKKNFLYSVAFEHPAGFKEYRILEEKLIADGSEVFSRRLAEVRLNKRQEQAAQFSVDWHLVALPIIHLSGNDSISTFVQWLGRLLILRPIPQLIMGESRDETLLPTSDAANFGAWFTGVVALAPSAYSRIDGRLRDVLPDLTEIRNPQVGTDFRQLIVQFGTGDNSLPVRFAALSDGEKCFMIWALVMAANETCGPLVCLWDEPENYLAPHEVWHCVMGLRQAFQSRGQFIATSHNPEAIRAFSLENTLLLHRKSHAEPTIVRPATTLETDGDFIGALVRGDIEP